MHEHKHNCCEHCLHYCPHCGKVYCCKCKQEWGNPYYYYPSYPYTPYYPYWGTTTITYSGTTATESAGAMCSHAH